MELLLLIIPHKGTLSTEWIYLQLIAMVLKELPYNILKKFLKVNVNEITKKM